MEVKSPAQCLAHSGHSVNVSHSIDSSTHFTDGVWVSVFVQPNLPGVSFAGAVIRLTRQLEGRSKR